MSISIAGWEKIFPTNAAGKWNFSYHPAGSVEQIFFFPATEKEC